MWEGARSSEYRIVTRFTLLLVVIVSAMLVLLSAVSYYSAKKSLESQLQAQIRTATDRLSVSLPSSVWNFDGEQIDKTLRAEMSMPAIDAIVVTNAGKFVAGIGHDKDGKVGAMSDLAAVASDDVRALDLTITENGKRETVGKVAVHFSHSQIRTALREQLVLLVLQALVLDVVLSFVVWRILALVVLRPLAQTRDGLERIASGDADLTRRLPASNSQEFKGVVEGFNTFVERLEKVIVEVQANAVSCAESIAKVEQGNLDFAARTEAQVDRLQQISAAIEELTSAVANNADNAGQADNLTGTTSELVGNGNELMRAVISTMGGLNEGSRQMADIINVIDSIAFQTNILALNAAVEAARAGEQGRGFAVVASEVRNLAQRSAQAAKEIKVLITDSIQRVESGAKQASQAGDAMQRIVASIEEVRALVKGISDASREQQSGIEQISTAIIDIDQATHSNADLVHENSQATREVRGQMDALVGAVGVFTVSKQPAIADKQDVRPRLANARPRQRVRA